MPTSTANSVAFLEHKRKKKWVDKSSGHNCFKLFARSLYITWAGEKDAYWTWNCFKETEEENIEVAKLISVCWVDVRGKFEVSELTPGVKYEVVYVVKLTKGASGWELPIKLRLSLTNGRIFNERQAILFNKPRGEDIELNVGSLSVRNGETGEVCFDLYEHGGHWKSGLIIKGAVLRPMK